MFKKLSTMVLTALLVLVINVPVIVDANAKGFSSSRSFSSSSRSSYSSKSSFSSYKKSSSSKSSKSSKSTKVASASTATTKSKFGGKSKKASYSTVTSSHQKRTAKAALNKNRAKFKKPARSTSSANTTKSKYRSNSTYAAARSSNPSTYYTRRNSYYAGYHTPSYVYMGSPSYGIWDTIFLYSMLSSMNSNNNAGQFAHNYANDGDYQQWRREANVLANDNAELRAQLAAMDAQTAKLANTPIKQGYVPNGVDADIMLSADVLSSMKPTMNVCVGSTSGAYFRVLAGIVAPSTTSTNMVAITTGGTGETLARLADGTCDAGFVQGDGYWNYVEENNGAPLPFERVFSPYQEAIHLVCNENGPSSIGELTSKNKVYFPAGSGAEVTWKNLAGTSANYKQVKTIINDNTMKVDSYEEAMLKASADKNACAMYVAAPGSTNLMRNIDQGAKSSKLVLVDVQDSTLDETTDPSGTRVYTNKSIDSYKQLQRKGSCYGYCGGSVDSLYVNADFIVNNKWKDKNKSTYSSLAVELIGMTSEIHGAVKQ